MRRPDDPTQAKLELKAAIQAGEISIGEAVKAMRKITGLNRQDFAKKIAQVSPRILGEIERDEANPTIQTLNKIGRVFGYQIGWVSTQRPGSVSKP